MGSLKRPITHLVALFTCVDFAFLFFFLVTTVQSQVIDKECPFILCNTNFLKKYLMLDGCVSVKQYFSELPGTVRLAKRCSLGLIEYSYYSLQCKSVYFDRHKPPSIICRCENLTMVWFPVFTWCLSPKSSALFCKKDRVCRIKFGGI